MEFLFLLQWLPVTDFQVWASLVYRPEGLNRPSPWPIAFTSITADGLQLVAEAQRLKLRSASRGLMGGS